MKEFVMIIEEKFKEMMKLIENSFDDDESPFDGLPSSSEIENHLFEITKSVQKIYDDWDQSVPEDDELNGGGICHLIADEISSILNRAGMKIYTQSSMNEQHVYCVGQFSDGVFEIDVPYRIYETGGGFTWYKIPGVKFEPDYIYIHRLNGNPAKISDYVEDWED